jgi:hypothetical protein
MPTRCLEREKLLRTYISLAREHASAEQEMQRLLNLTSLSRHEAMHRHCDEIRARADAARGQLRHHIAEHGC